MRKAVALLGLVLIPMGIGSVALAQGGSDSSGTHSYTLECDGGTPVFTNTSSSGNLLFVQQGGGGGMAAVQAGSNLFMGDGNSYTVQFRDPPTPSGSLVLLDSGTVPQCEGEDLQPPALLNECRGEDWYIVHPGGNWAYRLSTGDILYREGYTSNNPAAVYGEVLIPAGVDEVGYADDFNGTHTATRPDCSVTPPTTPTTEPTTPGQPAPGTPGLGAIEGGGFVAPGAEIGPGEVTFGVSGFQPGEQVTVTLFSTPRELGTVTAADNGNASITFELLASDGAGEHRVQFSGQSGTFSVPFTLVLPGQSLPVTR